MQAKHLFTAIGGLLAVASILPAHAALINHTTKDGLWLQISGSVSPQVSVHSNRLHYVGESNTDPFNQYKRPASMANESNLSVVVNQIINNPTYKAQIEDVLAAQDKKDSDERARMEGLGLGRLDFIATQKLTRNTSIAGEVVLYGNEKGMRPYNLGLRLTNDKIGSLGIQTNAIFQNGAARPSGTYSTIDMAGSSFSASYTKIPNLNISGYYALPASNDIRLPDAALTGGYGGLVSYTHNLAPKHIVRAGVAHTRGERGVRLVSNNIYKDKSAVAAGVQYQYQDLNVSVDASRATEDLNGLFVTQTKTKTHGFRLNYQFTPRLSAHAYYGEEETRKTSKAPYAFDMSTFMLEVQIAAALNKDATVVGVNDGIMFDKVEKRMYGVGASYNLYRNVTLNGSIGRTDITNYLKNGMFSDRENLNYRMGMTLSF